jgi:hypothetical protein
MTEWGRMTELSAVPITSMNDMLGRLDIIIGSAQQLLTDDDIELNHSIALRMQEIVDALADLDGTLEEWHLAAARIRQIRDTVRQRTIRDLDAHYHESDT